MEIDPFPPVTRRRPHRAGYLLSLPERTVRAISALVFGTVHETAQLLLPRLVRRSRLYEATAKNMLRIAIELVGGVEAQPAAALADGETPPPTAGRVAVKKAAGNAVEFGSIAAFGFSPLWLLAAASDVLNGTKTYLRALEEELARAGILAEGTHFGSVDDLLGALEGTTGHTASLIDMPPVELAELRRSIGELKGDVAALPTPRELAALFDGLVRTARMEGRSLLDVSTGIGFAFLTSARNVTRQHLVTPYGEDWRPVRDEGFGAYASRIAMPYRRAINGHFDGGRATWTEKVSARIVRLRRKE
ncbi:MAG TPA: hypothetical protein PJ994_10005 [Tepidiformaceae bacterium]|nr:hypothetical protein [Tepidiformaceae bacterium]